MIKTQYSRWAMLLFVCLAAGSSLVKAQAPGQHSRHACSNSKPATFTIQCKDRYYLGETPTITIVINNTGRSLKTVKEADNQKFSLEMTGLFSSDNGRDEKKNAVYECCWAEPPPQTDPNITLWYAPVRLRTRYVTLRPGESTSLTLDLPKKFQSEMEVGKYTLTVKSEDGKKV